MPGNPNFPDLPGITYLAVSAGIFEVPGPTMDPMYYPAGGNTYNGLIANLPTGIEL